MSISPATERRSAGSISMAVAVAAFLVAVLAVVITSDDPPTTRVDASSAGGLSPTVELTLSEFAIKPASVSAAPGRLVLRVRTRGPWPTTSRSKALGKKTVDLQPGASETLDLGELAPGEYTLVCSVPGHKDSGMTATLVVGEAGSSGSHVMPDGSVMTGDEWQRVAGVGSDYAQMDEDMLASFKAFPAAAKASVTNSSSRPSSPTAPSSSSSPPRSPNGRSSPARSSTPGPTTARCRRR